MTGYMKFNKLKLFFWKRNGIKKRKGTGIVISLPRAIILIIRVKKVVINLFKLISCN